MRHTRTRADTAAQRHTVLDRAELPGRAGPLTGQVPAAVRAQLLTLLKRGRAESAAEYAARVAEADR